MGTPTATGTTYFNPRPPHGGRQNRIYMVSHEIIFQSTPSSRRATILSVFPSRTRTIFQSTPSSRRATYTAMLEVSKHYISIHALLTEGDTASCYFVSASPRFQSTPSSRRATQDNARLLRLPAFQSTPSSRRATASSFTVMPVCAVFQSTPSSRRATLRDGEGPAGLLISIHALLTEGDA